MAQAGEPPADLFGSVYFAVIPSDDLGGNDFDNIKHELESFGATYCPFDSIDKLHEVTHIISTTADFPAYHDASDAFINVVKPLWVRQSVLKHRLANPRQFNPDPSLFFSSIVITCADDLPQGDKDALIGGVLAMGGQYSVGMTKLVTHVIALTMNTPQCQLIVDKKLTCKPVLPHWFDDCLKLGKKIDDAPYCLPDPSILQELDGTQITFDGPFGGVASAKTTAPEEEHTTTLLRDRTENLSVFRNKQIYLDQEIGISQHLRTSLEDIIKTGGGTIIDAGCVEKADTLICQLRTGAFSHASPRSGRDVGNLNWLYHLIRTNKWTSPMNQLLYYPLPAKAIPEFKNMRISVSNYAGDARSYLEHLITAAGAKFTKTFSSGNTHLITANLNGDKCDAAKDWGQRIVNHLWLEECYAQCRPLSEAVTRYITFPERTNLGEVIGQTSINRDVIEEKYFPQKTTRENLNASQGSEALSQIEPNRRPPIIAMFDGKENNTENGREMKRKAKANAVSKLHSMASDIALFEKESRRVGGVLKGGRRVNDPDRVSMKSPNPQNRKRSLDAVDDVSMSDVISVDTSSTGEKGQKKQKKVAEQLRIMVTGVKAKDGGFNWDDEKADQLRDYGIVELEDVPTDMKFDVLVAPKIMKTKKYLAGIAAAPAIVTPAWLEAMCKQRKLLPTKGFEMHDKETERKEDYKLKDSLARARENKKRGGLLRGLTIYCTENVKAGYDSYAHVLQSNGARCCLYKGRTGIPAPEKPVTDAQGDSNLDGPHDDDMPEHFRERLYLVTSTQPQDKRLWKRFREMAEEGGYRPSFVQPEWVQRLAVTQDIGQEPDDYEFDDQEVDVPKSAGRKVR
ncbi:MAG: hypothetical protein M1828_000408 [Chrysothrix sp. TS-e1954]|nr:MAG: hypothetical protein M1828_000408 [Chrysothrix sp. TS-e1954]